MHLPRPATHITSLWTPEHAALALGISIRTLAAWRSTGRHGLPYVKIGRLVRYREQDIRNWLQSQLQCSEGSSK